MLSSYYPMADQEPFHAAVDKLMPMRPMDYALPPLMMRSRSSSATSSEVTPVSEEAISNLRRNNSAEKSIRQRAVPTPPPRAPLPPTPRPSIMHHQLSCHPKSPSVGSILASIPNKRPTTPAPTIHDIQRPSSTLQLPSSPPNLRASPSLRTMISSANLRMKRQRQQQQHANAWGYILEQNHTEQDRLVAQHYLLRMMFGGVDYNAPVSLDNNNSFGAKSNIVVLDVGCGPGAWTMEMATAFPKATFIGIDKDDFFPQDIKPKNCHFRQYTIGEDGTLPFPDNSFNFIYQRDFNWALTTDMWTRLINEYMRILKPGGWIELVESDVETKSSMRMECAMNDKLLEGMALRHQEPHIARHLSTLLAVNGFRRVQSQFQSFPLGWDKEQQAEKEKQNDPSTLTPSELAHQQKQKRIRSELARLAASQYLFLLQSLRPWLSLVMNLSTDKYNNYIIGLPEEWRQGQTYTNWHCATAQKPPITRF